MIYELYTSPDMFLAEDGSYRPLCPVDDEFVAGEIMNRWFHREQSRRLKNTHESEMLKFDAELAELFFRMKQKLSRLGRNGQWNRWLRQQGISRSTADRLVAQYAESYGLSDELRHREVIEPLQGNVCLAASRTSKRLEKTLRSPKSRMTFVRCLADLLGIDVEYGEGDSVRLTIPPPVDETEFSNVAPNIVEITDDGTVKPVNYELPDGDGAEFPIVVA